jgi:hypothetical protein
MKGSDRQSIPLLRWDQQRVLPKGHRNGWQETGNEGWENVRCWLERWEFLAHVWGVWWGLCPLPVQHSSSGNPFLVVLERLSYSWALIVGIQLKSASGPSQGLCWNCKEICTVSSWIQLTINLPLQAGSSALWGHISLILKSAQGLRQTPKDNFEQVDPAIPESRTS